MVTVNVVTIAAYRRIYWLRLIGLVQRLAATWRCLLHSSDEPGELLQWLWHNDSTINSDCDINIIISSTSSSSKVQQQQLTICPAAIWAMIWDMTWVMASALLADDWLGWDGSTSVSAAAAAAGSCDAVNADSDGGTDRYGRLKLTTSFQSNI